MKRLPFLLFLLILGSFVTAQKAPNSQNSPENYSPTITKETINLTDQKKSGFKADILLVQTSLPWDSRSNTVVLDQLGYSYDIADINSISGIDLFQYPVILVVNDQVQAFYDSYAAERASFENYVEKGGALLFFAASNGWANGTLNAPLPGGIEVITPHFQHYNYIVREDHPIITGELSDNIALNNADLYNYYCSHGYFSSLPEDAVVILEEENKLPTLIEYPLGEGKVVASTQTWEHAHMYDTYSKEFARKALDDVFLYMFSEGYKPQLKDLSLELRIEDANPGIIVNKIEESYLDVAIRIENKGSEPLKGASLSLEPEKVDFYESLEVLGRNSQGDALHKLSEETLTDLSLGEIDINESFEIVYRFYIRKDYIPNNSIGIDYLKLSFTSHLESETGSVSSNNESIHLLERIGSLLITNRKLLYEKFDETEVNRLLAKVFELSQLGNEYPFMIYYVERYSELAANWDQNVDYGGDLTEINKVAIEIDNLVEDWYNRVNIDPLLLPELLKPQYLTILGADDIIPFHRLNNITYQPDWPNDKEWLHNDPKQTPGEAVKNPEFKCYMSNHFFTDNLYGDTDGKLAHAEKGNLDLAVGRIVGHDAQAMKFFLENANAGPKPVKTSFITTLGDVNDVQIDNIEDAMNMHNINILGESNPDLIGNDNYSKQDFLNVIKQDFQVGAYMAHGAHNRFGLHHNINSFNDLLFIDEMNSRDFPNFSRNNPFLYSIGCHNGVVTNLNMDPLSSEENDCVTYKLAELGISGFASIAGYGQFQTTFKIMQYDEELINIFFEHLWMHNGSSLELGKVLQIAKKEYGAGIFEDNGEGKKTRLQNLYYGLPWTKLKTEPSGAKKSGLMDAIEDYSVPDTIIFEIGEYNFETDDGYEMLVVEAAKNYAEKGKPIIPYLTRSYKIPLGSKIDTIQILKEESTNLGVHNIYVTQSTRIIDSLEEVNMEYNFSIYPDKRLTYNITEFDEYSLLTVNYSPVSINGTSRELTLFTNAEIGINVELDKTIIVNDFSASSNLYGIGDSLMCVVEILNVGSKSEDLVLHVTGKEEEYEFTDLHVEGGAKAQYELTLWELDSAGYQDAILLVKNSVGDTLCGSIIQFNVATGRIAYFEFPDTIHKEELANFEIGFENFAEQAIQIEADISIFNDKDENVLNLITKQDEFNPDSPVELVWNWKTSSLKRGNYYARGFVNTPYKKFGPVEKQFFMEKSLVLKGVNPHDTLNYICSNNDFIYSLQLKHLYNPEFRWYWNGELLEDQNSDTLQLLNFASEQDGYYYCMVFNEIDTVFSDSLKIQKQFQYEQMRDINLCEGQSFFAENKDQIISGTYIDTLQSLEGCDSLVITNLAFNPTFENDIRISICYGDKYFVEEAYQDESGIYMDTLTTIAGCDSVIVTELTILPLNQVDLGSDTVVYLNDTLRIHASEGFSSYQWTSGDTTSSIFNTYADVGTYEYKVIAIDENGCSSSDSISIQVELSNALMNSGFRDAFRVFPNPTENRLIIQTNIEIESEVLVSIINQSGQEVYSIRKEAILANSTFEIDFKQFNPGFYFLRINTAEDLYMDKIIKQ